MTPYARIISYLDDDIGRGDLKAAGVYDRRIQRSLAKYHRKEFWQRDIVDSDPILFPAPYAAVQQIDLRNLPRFRKLAYMRDYDPNATYVDPTNQVKIGVAGVEYDEISLPFGTDYFGYDKNYVFYRAGEVVNLRSKGPIKAVLIGYYVDPLVEPVANINSWIADLYPDLIAADVKVRIFSDIGKDAEAKGARDERMDFEMNLFANNLYTSYKKG
jgi:hypothetical protein